MYSPRSFAKYYWLVWFAALVVFIISSQFIPIRESLGWFALFSGIFGVYSFHFEFGRLLGFLETHAPAAFAELPKSWVFELLAFFNPRLLRLPESNSPHYDAVHVYRSAWLFSVVAAFLPLVLNWVL